MEFPRQIKESDTLKSCEFTNDKKLEYSGKARITNQFLKKCIQFKRWIILNNHVKCKKYIYVKLRMNPLEEAGKFRALVSLLNNSPHIHRVNSQFHEYNHTYVTEF